LRVCTLRAHLDTTDRYAGRVFSYPVHETWEFTSANPIRSTFPLWLAYGWPMYILRWLWEGFGYEVSPSVVYWTLRVLMLSLSVVMEDWAIHELVESPRARSVAVPLVASSYVTWTFQTHTFSNSIETLLVSWSLVLIQRIVGDKVRARRSALRCGTCS
jgi:phosphatidylinositol glycan class Z